MSVFFSRPLDVSVMRVMGGKSPVGIMMLVQSFCSIASTGGFIGVYSKNLCFHSLKRVFSPPSYDEKVENVALW